MTVSTQPTADGIGGADRARLELLDVQAVSSICGCSPRHIYRMADGGKMPRPLRLGAAVRWRRDELMAWIGDGCKPARAVKRGAR